MPLDLRPQPTTRSPRSLERLSGISASPTSPPAVGGPGRAFGAGLTRRGAALTLVIFLAVLGAAMGIFRDAQIPPRGEGVPASAESARVAAELAARPRADVQPVLLVATRADGAALTTADERALADVTATVTPSGLPRVGPPAPTMAGDGRAAYTLVPVRVGAENSDNVATITDLREGVRRATPTGLRVLVTGGPAFGADIADAFSGANVRLLLVTVGVVAFLLLLTYRSPILWLVPLVVVGMADQLAGAVTRGVGQASGLTFDAGIVSVLVFGAGTNYALVLISRYREELGRDEDHRVALARARAATAPAILASNLTVVLCLLTLLLAVVPGTRGLGLAGAVGLLIALLAALAVLPAALALAGRRIFWPLIPRPGDEADDQAGVWGRGAHRHVHRPSAAGAGCDRAARQPGVVALWTRRAPVTRTLVRSDSRPLGRCGPAARQSCRTES